MDQVKSTQTISTQNIYPLKFSSRNDINHNECDIKNESETNCKLTTLQKYFYTAILCYTNLTYGIVCTALSPTLVDLKHLFSASMHQVSLYYTINSIGYVFGALFGFLYKYLNRQITIMCLCSIMGIAFSIIPYSYSLNNYYTIGFIIGVGGGAFDCALTVWLIEMWKDKCSPSLQLAQFSYGIGAIFSPLISRNFIHGDDRPVNELSEDISQDIRQSLSFPFAINGSLQFLSGVFQLIALIMFKKYEFKDENQRNNLNAKETIPSLTKPIDPPIEDTRQLTEHKTFSKIFMILGAICLASYNACESGHFQFAPTFSQYIPLHLSAPDAALIHSFFASSCIITRGIAIFISIKLKSKSMLIGNYTLVSIGLVMLLFSGSSKTLLIVSNIVMGIGCSSFWPGFFAFIEQYIKFNDKVGTIFIFSLGIALAIQPLYFGRIIEKRPMFMVYSNMTTLSLSMITFIIILITLYFHKRKLVRKSVPTV